MKECKHSKTLHDGLMILFTLDLTIKKLSIYMSSFAITNEPANTSCCFLFVCAHTEFDVCSSAGVTFCDTRH